MEVMVYVDPTPRGGWALALARQLSASWATRLHLLATLEDVAADAALLARARTALGAGAPVSEAVRPGPAERAVVDEAGSHAWGLVIVPPAGRGAIARMLRGSRVATVVRAVQAPVLVARRPPARVDRVLGALSGRRSTEAVVDAALEWERRTGARARFVHVSAEVPVGRVDTAADERDLDRELDHVLAVLHRRAATDRLAIRDGLVVDEVLDTFEQEAHQLLVIGACDAADAGFGREDVTERLLLSCPASTLVVPRLPAGSPAA